MKTNQTFQLQSQLGAYCRTGKNKPLTSIPEHTQEYRRLVNGVLKDTLNNAFPMTKNLIGKKRWKKSIKYFFSNHACQTPQTWKLPLEFINYYNEVPFPFKKNFPFLNELLQYEWLEIEVFLMEDILIPPYKEFDNKHTSIIIPNPEIRILPLSYPIHIKKTHKIKPKHQGQFFVGIYRHPISKKVFYIDLPYIFVHLLVKINEADVHYYELLDIIHNIEPNETLKQNILNEFIAFGHKNHLILGNTVE